MPQRPRRKNINLSDAVEQVQKSPVESYSPEEMMPYMYGKTASGTQQEFAGPKPTSTWQEFVDTVGPYLSPFAGDQPDTAAPFEEKFSQFADSVSKLPLKMGQSLHAFNDALARLDIPSAAWHLAGLVPNLGEAGQQATEEIKQGHLTKAVAHVAGALYQAKLLSPKIAEMAKDPTAQQVFSELTQTPAGRTLGKVTSMAEDVAKGTAVGGTKGVKGTVYPFRLRYSGPAVVGSMIGGLGGHPYKGALAGEAVTMGMEAAKGAVQDIRGRMAARAAQGAEDARMGVQNPGFGPSPQSFGATPPPNPMSLQLGDLIQRAKAQINRTVSPAPGGRLSTSILPPQQGPEIMNKPVLPPEESLLKYGGRIEGGQIIPAEPNRMPNLYELAGELPQKDIRNIDPNAGSYEPFKGLTPKPQIMSQYGGTVEQGETPAGLSPTLPRQYKPFQSYGSQLKSGAEKGINLINPDLDKISQGLYGKRFIELTEDERKTVRTFSNPID